MDVVQVSWNELKHPGIPLGLGSGDGDRLMAPGVPDGLLADGKRLGLYSHGALTLIDPALGRALLIPLDDDIEAVIAAGGRWLAVTESGVAAVDPEQGLLGVLGTDVVEDLERVVLGGACVVVDSEEARAAFTPEGKAIAVPAAAVDARVITPLHDRAGLAWADEEHVRISVGGAVRTVAELTDRVTDMVAGPGDVLLAKVLDGACFAITGGGAVALEEDTLPETARFSPEGDLLLAAVAGGAGLIDLKSGALLKRWSGAFSPVGFIEGRPLLFDEAKGAVVDGAGAVVLEGLSLAGACYDPPVLYGPGGTAWDLSEGERSWDDAPLEGGVTAADGEQVVHLAGRSGALLDEYGNVQSRWRIPLFPDTREEQTLSAVRTGGGSDEESADEIAEIAWLEDQALVLTTEGELGLLDPTDGTLLHRESLGAYEETDGWPGLTQLPRGRVLVRVGDAGRVMPGGQQIAAPAGQVHALKISGDLIYRAWGSRLECATLGGEARWSLSMKARLLALGRRLMAAEGDDLVVLDAERGHGMDRNPEALEGCNAMAVLSDGHLWAWGGFEGSLRVARLDGRTGATLGEWELPADGVVVGGGSAWVWTDEGTLFKLAID
jgi:hypothetical protein